MARNRVKQCTCPNCDYKFNEIDNFCPNCGQENHTHKLPVKHFVLEYLENVFHFDTKMLVTLRDLLIYPGRITSNYNANKRARYVPPMRLFIFVSFIFFFLTAVIPERQEKESDSNKVYSKFEEKQNKITRTSMPEQVVDSTDEAEMSLSFLAGRTKNTTTTALYDSIKKDLHPDNELIDKYLIAAQYDIKWYNHNLLRNIIKLNTGHFTIEDIKHKIEKTISTLMFFMMPVFAFILWLFFYNKKNFYTEHLIFSIHIHSIAYIILTVYLFAAWAGFDYFSVPFLAILAYTVLCARNVYKTRWRGAILRILSAGFFYSISLLIIFVFGFIISFF